MKQCAVFVKQIFDLIIHSYLAPFTIMQRIVFKKKGNW